jgi:hypothetical protein
VNLSMDDLDPAATVDRAPNRQVAPREYRSGDGSSRPKAQVAAALRRMHRDFIDGLHGQRAVPEGATPCDPLAGARDDTRRRGRPGPWAPRCDADGATSSRLSIADRSASRQRRAQGSDAAAGGNLQAK